MAVTSIADVLALIGGPGLDDGTTGGRKRFTSFLCQAKWRPEDLWAWIEECLDRGSRAHPEYYYAIQDIVVSIGTHLGFEVEFGPYTGAGDRIPYDGRWQATTGEEILVEVKSSTWPIGSTSQLTDYMTAYALDYKREARQVFGLYTVGDGDFGALVDQVRGGEYRNRLKVISFSDIIRLFRLRRSLDEQLPAEQVCQVIQDLLLPFDSINVGGILDIIEGVAGLHLGGPDNGHGAEPAPAEREWRRSELHAFLDESQPQQIGILLALCTAPDCKLHRKELVRRMSAFASSVPGLDPAQKLTTRTVGGARSGISKREQQIGKDSLIEDDATGYALRPDCRDWTIEWLEDQGLLPVQLDFDRDLGGLFAEAATA